MIMTMYDNVILLPKNIGSVVEYDNEQWIVKSVWMDMCGLNYSLVSVASGRHTRTESVQYNDVTIIDLHSWTDRDDVIMSMLRDKYRDAVLNRNEGNKIESIDKIKEIQELIWREQLKVARDKHTIEQYYDYGIVDYDYSFFIF